MAKFEGGQVGAGEGEPQEVPGVAFHEITMERFHRGPSNDEIRKLLFGDLKIRESSDSHQQRIQSPLKIQSKGCTRVCRFSVRKSKPVMLQHG